MAKFKTHTYEDGRILHKILGTNWAIWENLDSTNKFFVHNDDAEINDLFFVDMPEQYKTMDSALDAIQEFLHLNDYFEPDIGYCEDQIEAYQQANLTYMK